MLHGILLNHVGDFIPKGNGPLKEKALSPLNQTFKIGKYFDASLKYVGLDISQK